MLYYKFRDSLFYYIIVCAPWIPKYFISVVLYYRCCAWGLKSPFAPLNCSLSSLHIHKRTTPASELVNIRRRRQARNPVRKPNRQKFSQASEVWIELKTDTTVLELIGTTDSILTLAGDSVPVPTCSARANPVSLWTYSYVPPSPVGRKGEDARPSGKV
jgi:hypothetical protein